MARPSHPSPLLWALLVLIPLAHGHGTIIPHDLTGVSLCVDDDSIAVSFAGPTGERTAELVRERLDRALVATFDGAAVPWQRRRSCPDSRGYVEVALHVDDADWFAARAASYLVAVRVGWRQAGAEGVRADPADAFDFREEELFDEAAVGVPSFVFLPRYVEAGLRDLVVSWWEDREEPSAAYPLWVPPLGAALSVASAAACVSLLRRRGAA